MIAVLTAAQMRAVDAAVCERIGDDALMRTAGVRIAQRIAARVASGRIVAFAGPGNNGGDAFAALAELPGSYERIVYAMPATRRSRAAGAAQRRALDAGVILRDLPAGDAAADLACEQAALLLDALVGTGARLPLPQSFHPAIRAMARRQKITLAVDIPSGVDADSGAIAEPCVRADETVTLGALKPGLLLDPARSYVGSLWLADIGMEDELAAVEDAHFCADDDDAFLDRLPVRKPTADKRAAGATLILAGSTQFPGAAILAARAAARAGAGYVTVATPAGAAPALRAQLIEQVVVTLGEEADPESLASEILELTRRGGSLAIGPGLDLNERTGVLVRSLIARAKLPMVIDASALFHLAKHLDILKEARCVLTPHAGEFARLSGEGTLAEADRTRRLRAFVERTGAVTLLKGRATLVDDARYVYINTTGTDALATAGSGDVLTGVTAALLAQGLSPFDAACTAAYWHGLAGQFAASRRPVGVVASDLLEALGAALPVRRASRPPLQRIF
ncbi:MAG: NAD(P)H-hydrate dehydratase [Vulcanimicrobiaceae bacterium]